MEIAYLGNYKGQNLGVGGARRRVLDRKYLPLAICDLIQGCDKNSCIYVGNVNKGGVGQFGNVYCENGLSPTITAGTHGYCIGHILVEENETDSIRIYGQRNRETSE